MNYSKIRRLYLKYSYMFTRSEFYDLVHNSLDSIIDEDDIKFDDDTIFDIDKYIDSQALKQEVFNLIKNCGFIR